MSPKNLVRATEHNPATDIQSIRELLRGYGSTVSLLKEMVQNAIDAEAENVGVMKTEKQLRVLQDKEVFNLLNKIAATLKPQFDEVPPRFTKSDQAQLDRIFQELTSRVPELMLPFKAPDLELIGVIKGLPPSYSGSLQ